MSVEHNIFAHTRPDAARDLERPAGTNTRTEDASRQTLYRKLRVLAHGYGCCTVEVAVYTPGCGGNHDGRKVTEQLHRGAHVPHCTCDVV